MLARAADSLTVMTRRFQLLLALSASRRHILKIISKKVVISLLEVGMTETPATARRRIYSLLASPGSLLLSRYADFINRHSLAGKIAGQACRAVPPVATRTHIARRMPDFDFSAASHRTPMATGKRRSRHQVTYISLLVGTALIASKMRDEKGKRKTGEQCSRRSRSHHEFQRSEMPRHHGNHRLARLGFRRPRRHKIFAILSAGVIGRAKAASIRAKRRPPAPTLRRFLDTHWLRLRDARRRHAAYFRQAPRATKVNALSIFPPTRQYHSQGLIILSLPRQIISALAHDALTTFADA